MSQSRIWSPQVLGAFILIGLICSGAAFGQVDPVVPQTKPTETTPASAPQTRARQVAKPAPDKSEEEGTKLVDKATPPVNEDDAFAALREQIEASTAPAERARLRLQLADQLAEAEMKSEAIAELHTLLLEERFDPAGFYNIGNRLVRLGDGTGAVVAYRKAIDQRQGNYSRALNNLGFLLLKDGQWDLSYDALMSALRLEGFRYAEASYNLGRLYAARGEMDLAVREWRRALAVDPKHAGATLALRENQSSGKITVTNNPAVGITASSNKVSPGKPTTAPANRTLTVDQKGYDLLQRARNARDHGRNEEAVTEYRSLLARSNGYFAPANLELAYALTTLKRNDEAIASLLAVSANDGARYPIAYYHLARLYEVKGQLKLAEENYSRAVVSYGGDNFQFLLDLSRVREKLEDLPGALLALEQYVQASERAGSKPEWADERLTQLREKSAAATAGTTKK